MRSVASRLALAVVVVLGSGTTRLSAQEQARKPPVDDGWPDLSSFLKEKYGFLPIAVPITEPAVGYGVAGGMAFLSKSLGQTQAGFGRPDITMVGGMGTENDSWAAAAGDIRYWLEDKLQTRVFAATGSVNLDFFGVGSDAVLDDQPLRYNLEPLGTSLEARYRLDDTPWWVGLNYTFASVDVSFDTPAGTPGQPAFRAESEVGGLTPLLSFDSRNNIFTPTTGTLVELTVGLFDEAFGGDEAFQKVYLLGMHFEPLAEQWFLGVRVDAAASFGDVPFYLRPFVALRGVPMLRYQGETTASLETELRWQFWERFSLVGFGGVGGAWNDFEQLDDKSNAVAGGLGLRYELAREYGIHAGFDVAVGPEETVLYIQVGSAWVRP